MNGNVNLFQRLYQLFSMQWNPSLAFWVVSEKAHITFKSGLSSQFCQRVCSLQESLTLSVKLAHLTFTNETLVEFKSCLTHMRLSQRTTIAKIISKRPERMT
jgi:hypothetical protein